MQIFILLFALSIDLFIASLACGMDKIRIKILPSICISLTCSLILTFSLLLGTVLDGIIKEKYTTILCFMGLFMIGFIKIQEFLFKMYIDKHKSINKNIKISLKYLNIILNIYNNPVEVDEDHSSDMSIKESIFFALAMSFDALFGGISAAFLKIDIPCTIIFNLLLSFLLILLGECLGRKASKVCSKDMSWLSGILFIILAFCKII